jgi:hypothetical protein
LYPICRWGKWCEGRWRGTLNIDTRWRWVDSFVTKPLLSEIPQPVSMPSRAGKSL